LEEEVELTSYFVYFLAKYQYEFNFIENYWGVAKIYAHQRYENHVRELYKIVPEYLNSVKPTLIWKF